MMSCLPRRDSEVQPSSAHSLGSIAKDSLQAPASDKPLSQWLFFSQQLACHSRNMMRPVFDERNTLLAKVPL